MNILCSKERANLVIIFDLRNSVTNFFSSPHCDSSGCLVLVDVFGGVAEVNLVVEILLCRDEGGLGETLVEA